MAGIKTGVDGQINNNIQTIGLVAYWDAAYNKSFTPGTTTSYNLASGSLTPTGSLLNDVGFQGPLTSSWVFDGTDDYIDCSSFPLLDSGSAVTISAWFKSSTYSNFGRLVNVEKHIEIFQGSSGASNTKGRFTYVLMGAYGNSFKTLGSTEASGVGDLVDGNWHHLCFVFEGATLTATVYEDSVAVVTGDTTKENLNSATDKLYIGADPSGANPITGNIANVQIYNQSFSAGDVLQNYNAQKNRFGL